MFTHWCSPKEHIKFFDANTNKKIQLDDLGKLNGRESLCTVYPGTIYSSSHYTGELNVKKKKKEKKKQSTN